MAIEFSLEEFSKKLSEAQKQSIDEDTTKTSNNNTTEVIGAVNNQNKSLVNTEKISIGIDDVIVGKNVKETKTRYNFTLKPSIKNILKIEAMKRNMSQSELLEEIINEKLGANK